MFSKSDLSVYINEILVLTPKWSDFFPSLDIAYIESRTEEEVYFCSSPHSVYSKDRGAIDVDPKLFWLQALLFLSQSKLSKWDQMIYWSNEETRPEQNRILIRALNFTLCLPLPVFEFNKLYTSITQGRLPHAWEMYGPLAEVMCMQQDSFEQIFLVKTAKWYVVFSWSTTA